MSLKWLSLRCVQQALRVDAINRYQTVSFASVKYLQHFRLYRPQGGTFASNSENMNARRKW